MTDLPTLEARVREAKEKFLTLLLRDILGENTNEPDAALDALIAAAEALGAARERSAIREAVARMDASLFAAGAKNTFVSLEDVLATIDSRGTP